MSRGNRNDREICHAGRTRSPSHAGHAFIGRIAHVIVNSGIDRPWSWYFCCNVAGNKEFVLRYPVATKRALRAIAKATNFCAAEPEQAARLVAAKGYPYDYALQIMKEIRYARWKEYDPEDTVRFYSLRLREAGMIKSIPQALTGGSSMICSRS